MTADANGKTLQRYARIAGLTYLLSAVAFGAPLEIWSRLGVQGDFARTAQNVATSESLLRVSLTGQFIGCLTILVLAWAFYGLLKRVGPGLALLALLSRSAEAVLMSVGSVLWFIALKNYTDAAEGSGAGLGEALDRILTSGINASFHMSMVFSSVGSILFFYLLFKSRSVPRLLAGLSMAASALALTFAIALMLAPDQASALGMVGWGPIFIAEVGIGLWLLVRGVNLTSAS